MTAAEDVERQVAVAVIVAVEEPALLMAVQRVIRSVQIENDLRVSKGAELSLKVGAEYSLVWRMV